MSTEIDTVSVPLHSRYILTHVVGQSLAFPASWVTDILVIERSQVLALPFYNPGVTGVVHYQGKIVPLVSAHFIFTQQQEQVMKQTLVGVRLSQPDALAGVGVVVDRLVDSLTAEQLTVERVFQPCDLPSFLWQPQRWHLRG